MLTTVQKTKRWRSCGQTFGNSTQHCAKFRAPSWQYLLGHLVSGEYQSSNRHGLNFRPTPIRRSLLRRAHHVQHSQTLLHLIPRRIRRPNHRLRRLRANHLQRRQTLLPKIRRRIQRPKQRLRTLRANRQQRSRPLLPIRIRCPRMRPHHWVQMRRKIQHEFIVHTQMVRSSAKAHLKMRNRPINTMVNHREGSSAMLWVASEQRLGG